jgi:ABC-2 type transport system permease protein
VFGAAIGGRMSDMAGVEYGSFIVPGLILLSVLTQALMNASFGIFFPKFTGTIYEILSAPLSPLDTVVAYVGAAASKAVILALVTLATATLFVTVRIDHPLLMLAFLIAISVGFCLLGFAIGIWAQNFEQLQVVPMLVVTPLTFLGGVFYSVAAIGEPWRTVTHLNPILYLVSGYRWTFFGVSDVPLWSSVAVMAAAILLPFAAIVWIFRTGYRLKQ